MTQSFNFIYKYSGKSVKYLKLRININLPIFLKDHSLSLIFGNGLEEDKKKNTSLMPLLQFRKKKK